MTEDRNEGYLSSPLTTPTFSQRAPPPQLPQPTPMVTQAYAAATPRFPPNPLSFPRATATVAGTMTLNGIEESHYHERLLEMAEEEHRKKMRILGLKEEILMIKKRKLISGDYRD